MISSGKDFTTGLFFRFSIPKRLRTILFYLVVTFCCSYSFSLQGLSEEYFQDDYAEKITITDLSLELNIPPGWLIDYLELSPETARDYSIEELGISLEEVEEVRLAFENRKWRFSWNIVAVGMLVIFLSLSLTGVFISLLSRIVIFSERQEKKGKPDREKSLERKKAKVGIGDVKSRDSGYNAVIAAITALHFHLEEAEEFGKMTLSWKREPSSVWRTSGKFEMPNRIIREIKKTR